MRLDAWDESTAVRELVDRYVRRNGPVTEDDIGWWTGLGRTVVQDALAALPDVLAVRVHGLEGVYLVHEADIALAQRSTASPADQVSQLRVLDPYLQSYPNGERCIDRRHRRLVIDRGGNATLIVGIAAFCPVLVRPIAGTMWLIQGNYGQQEATDVAHWLGAWDGTR